MTHTSDIVEIVARWAWGDDWREGLHPDHEDRQRAKVAALLDQIAPAAEARERQAVEAEREACARMVDPPLSKRGGNVGIWRRRLMAIAAAIRARGQGEG
jgi:hypothetical protein